VLDVSFAFWGEERVRISSVSFSWDRCLLRFCCSAASFGSSRSRIQLCWIPPLLFTQSHSAVLDVSFAFWGEERVRISSVSSAGIDASFSSAVVQLHLAVHAVVFSCAGCLLCFLGRGKIAVLLQSYSTVSD
jgi:hypothetical protein